MATIKELQERLEALEAEKAALQQENEQLKAGSVAQKGMVDQNTIMYQPREMKKIELFKDDYRYKKPLFVSINGRNWVIQRGVEVEVPDYVADFIVQQRNEERVIIRKMEEDDEAFRQLEENINRQAAP